MLRVLHIFVGVIAIVLDALLAHEDRYVRMTAASALGGIGPQAQDAVPALHEALNDQDEAVRQRVRVALDRIETRAPRNF